MQVAETFVSYQGEINVGRFAYFLRLGKCNLSCEFCDTPEKNSYAEIGIDEIVEQAQHFNHIVITGGEPLLQKEEVAKLILKLKKINPKIVIEIETNGTIKPSGMKNLDNVIFNVSPKLSNSENNYEKRIVKNVLTWFINYGANFKFVVNDEDDVDEVNMLVRDLLIPKTQIFLMPQGKTRQEQYEKMLEIINLAKRYGYNFSPRLQILLWDTERGR